LVALEDARPSVDSDTRIFTGRDDMIRFVLNNKADLAKGDKNGRNALIWAAVGGKLSSKLLLELDRNTFC
jgi:hypothetical protein